MNVLLWDVEVNPYKLAKLQWILFKFFGLRPKRKNSCGNTKQSVGFFCHLPFEKEFCDVINDGDIHKVVCKRCGCSRMSSNHYIDSQTIFDEWNWEWNW